MGYWQETEAPVAACGQLLPLLGDVSHSHGWGGHWAISGSWDEACLLATQMQPIWWWWCEGERGMSSHGGGGRTLPIVLASDCSAFKASLTILTWIHKLSLPELLSWSDQTQTDSLPPIWVDQDVTGGIWS